MEDLLLSRAQKYAELLNKSYNIVLGKKGKAYHIDLRFYKDTFFHLVGFQHLTDLQQLKSNKERIYKDILEGKLTYADITKSTHFDEWKIKERITYLYYLEEMLDHNNLTFLINIHEYVKYTKIKADYLFEYIFDVDTTLYFFSVKNKFPKIENECTGCSFFKKHEMNYRKGASPTTLLYNEKIIYDKNKIVENILLYKYHTYSI